jgi:hypothetical protein
MNLNRNLLKLGLQKFLSMHFMARFCLPACHLPLQFVHFLFFSCFNFLASCVKRTSHEGFDMGFLRSVKKSKYVRINSNPPPLALGYQYYFPWFICSPLSKNLSCVTGIQKNITLETLILPRSSCPCQSS